MPDALCALISRLYISSVGLNPVGDLRLLLELRSLDFLFFMTVITVFIVLQNASKSLILTGR
jgi:hypothetical protein